MQNNQWKIIVDELWSKSPIDPKGNSNDIKIEINMSPLHPWFTLVLPYPAVLRVL